eukprot:4369140-Pleurochrysis_carterae.AAC.1
MIVVAPAGPDGRSGKVATQYSVTDGNPCESLHPWRAKLIATAPRAAHYSSLAPPAPPWPPETWPRVCAPTTLCQARENAADIFCAYMIV